MRRDYSPPGACQAATVPLPARATRGTGTMAGFRKLWDRIARLGELPTDVTPHGLRHGFASLAADLGYSEPTIAALIGHKGQRITSRHGHTADAIPLRATG